MSEEEESNNENEENEEEEDNEEGEEKDDDEHEDDEGEGEENEDDEGGEEGENEEGEEKEDEEEEEDEEDDKKKKKGKKGGKKNDKEEKKEKEEEKPNSKFSEDKLHPSKEIKMDLNLNSSNNNIYFNGNDITLANIQAKKSTLQLLAEISTEMDTLSTHLEEVLPKEKPLKYNVMYPINNPIISSNDIPYPDDKQDLEIKKLIDRANELTNDSILYKKREENGESKIKTYEDKCCQSDDEIELSYNQQLEENRSREEDYYNRNYNTDNVNSVRRFPYDPYKHLGYYNDLRNNNDFRRRSLGQMQRGYNNNYNNYRNNFRGNDTNFERYKPGSVAQAMDILLDKK